MNSTRTGFWQQYRVGISYGTRTTIALMVPITVLTALGFRDASSWVGTGGLMSTVSDPGGDTAYRSRAFLVSATAFLVALTVIVGTMLGNWPWAMVAFMAIGGFLAIYASVLGDTGAALGQAVLNMIVMLPIAQASPFDGFARGGLAFAGGIAALAVALAVLPFRPRRPLFRSAASSLEALAGYATAIRSGSPDEIEARRLTAAAALTTAQASAAVPHWRPAVLWIGNAAVSEMLGQVADLNRLVSALALSYVPLREVGDETDLSRVVLGETETAIDEFTELLHSASAKLVSREVPALDTEPFVTAVETAQASLDQSRRATSDLTDTAMRQAVAGSIVVRELAAAVPAVKQLVAAVVDAPGVGPPRAVRTSRSPWADALTKLRDNFTLDSLYLRHALRVGAATGLGMALWVVTGWGNGGWIATTIAAILVPIDFGGQTRRVFQRSVATFLGALIALVVVSLTTNVVLFYAILTVLTFATFYFWAGKYSYFVFFLTPWAIALNGIDEQIGPADAVQRIGMTFAGTVIAFAFGAWFLPNRQKLRMHDAVTGVIEADRQLFAVTIVNAADASSSELRQASDRVVEAQEALQAALDRLRSSPRPDQPLTTLMEVVTDFDRQTGELAGAILALRAPPEPDTPLVCEASLHQIVSDFAHGLDGLVRLANDEKAAGGRDRNTFVPVFDELDHVIAALVAARRRELSVGQTNSPTDSELDRISLFRQNIAVIAMCLQNLETTLREIVGQECHV